MNLPPNVVLPDIFNLGVAPPPPQSAHRFAQRVRLAPPYALAQVTRGWEPSGGLILNSYFLPPTQLAGPVTQPPWQAGLTPNPYTPPAW